MATVPTVRQLSWGYFLLQLPLISLCFYSCYYLFDSEYFPVSGAILYATLAFSLRWLLAKDNYRGMRLVKQQRFAEALPFFERSVAFFTAHRWVDTYRFLTLLSSSGLSYRETSLCNIAFCYGQLGQGQLAKAAYEHVLREYPRNGMARSALNLIYSFSPAPGA